MKAGPSCRMARPITPRPEAEMARMLPMSHPEAEDVQHDHNDADSDLKARRVADGAEPEQPRRQQGAEAERQARKARPIPLHWPIA